MITLRKGDDTILLDETKIRMQLFNPLLSQEIIEGEYSFPFKIPNTAENLRIFEYESLLNHHGAITEISPGWKLYIDNVLMYIGNLEVYIQGDADIDANLRVNSSRLSSIKDLKLSELNWGADISLKIQKQNFRFNVQNDNIGTSRIFRFGTGGPGQLSLSINFTSPIVSNLNTLAAWINSNFYYSAYTVQATVIGSNDIFIEAQWSGIQPRLSILFETVSGSTPGTITVVSKFDYFDVYEVQWRLDMADKAAGKYPLNNYTYFPVFNEKANMPFDEVVGSTDFYPFYYQNYYKSYGSPLRFEPRPLKEHATISNYYAPHSTITPFIFVAYYLDLIAKEIDSYATSDFHTILDLQKIVVWVNTYGSNDTRARFVDIFNLKDFTPDMTVQEFMTQLFASFCIRPIIDDINKTCDFFHLQNLIDAAEIDWSAKQVTGHKIYAAKDITGVKLLYDKDTEDELVTDSEDTIKQWIFEGVFDEIVDLPSYLPVDEISTSRYAFVKEDAGFYKLNYSSLSGYTWVIIDEAVTRPEVPIIGTETSSREVKSADTLAYFLGVDPLAETPVTWKVPYIKRPIYSPFNEGTKVSVLRLLQSHGYAENDDGLDYPFASAEGINYNGDVVSDYSLTWGGDRGYYALRWKRWIEFLLKGKPVEMEFDLNINDFLNLPYKKRIFSNGQRYLLIEARPEFPITKPTLCRLLKIEN